MDRTLRIRLLGEVTIELAGSRVTGLPSRTAEALLIYLVCHKRPFSREVLAELLWDDRPPKQALANLRSTLSSLRRVFGDYLIITRQTAAFNHDSDYYLDTAEFYRLTTRLPDNPTTRPSDYPTTRQLDHPTTRLKDALALYRGDFLFGFYLRNNRGFEEWAATQRERWQRRAISALRQIVAAAERRGDYHDGIRYANRWLRLDPFNENAHRRMMTLQARTGQYNAALLQYRACRRLLADELGVDPAPATATLFRRIRSAHDLPPPKLPQPAAPFVGREAELAELIGRLADPTCRLITLLGPGGVGKTRLALQAVNQIAANRPGLFLHGIRFVPLTAVSALPSFFSALADAWQIPDYDAAAPLESVINFLREKEALLLLDNFEHLLNAHARDAADALADILQQAPLVRLLVTSQKRLNLREEWVFDLDGLPYPAEETAVPPDSFASIQLFVQRARRLCRAFRPTAADFRAITCICQAVDGFPLGIELAAAAVRRRSCPEIAGQLAQRLDCLADAPRNAPPRHQSLPAVFAYSWQMLTATEQTAVRRLSIVRSPLTLETAVAIADTTPETLHALVDSSFLRLINIPDAPARFEMHALARQFAGEALAAIPAAEQAARDRHSRIFAQFLNDQRARLHGHQQQEAITAVNAVIEEARAAWAWMIRRERWADLALALDGLYWFYWLRNWIQEGESALARAAAALAQSDAKDDLLLARIQSRQAELLIWQSRHDAAQALFTSALPTLTAHQAWGDLAWALSAQGLMAYLQSDYEAAWPSLKKALARFRQMNNKAGQAYVINLMGNVVAEGRRADSAESTRLYRESLAIYRELGDLRGQSKCLINLGATAQTLGDAAEARRLYREGIVICRRLNNYNALAVALTNLGQLEADQGNYAEGERLLLESLDIKREIGERRSLALALKQLEAVARQTGHFRQARTYLDEALAISRDLGTAVLMADLLTGAAALYAAQGQSERALELLTAVQTSAVQDREIMSDADALWQELAAALPPETAAACRRRGEGVGVETAVAAVLRDFRAGSAG